MDTRSGIKDRSKTLWMKRNRLFILAAMWLIAAVPQANAYKIILMGDSTVINSSLPAADKIETKLQTLLATYDPGTTWTVVNVGRGGEYVGPGSDNMYTYPAVPDKVAGVISSHPDTDMVLLRYGILDGKNYHPDTFKTRLAGLCDIWEANIPGVQVVLETSIYSQDAQYWFNETTDWPNYCAEYGFTQGDPRRDYLAPYYQKSRDLAVERGYPLVDIEQRMKYELDAGHYTDFGYNDIEDIHPNADGTTIIADEEATQIGNHLGLLAVEEVDPFYPQTAFVYPHPAASFVRISPGGPGTFRGALTITDAYGRTVKEACCNPGSAKEASFLWDGRDMEGRLVPAGAYYYRFTAGGIASEPRRFIVTR